MALVILKSLFLQDESLIKQIKIKGELNQQPSAFSVDGCVIFGFGISLLVFCCLNLPEDVLTHVTSAFNIAMI